MPKAVTEITSGNQFSRSGGKDGGGDNQTRVFRVILNSTTETFNPETNPDVNVKVGDKHPFNDVYCTGYSVRFDGDSRLVMLVTIEYGAAAGSQGDGQDPNSQPPEVRPANWSISDGLTEHPIYKWKPRTAAAAWGDFRSATNSAGDMYDAITQLTSLVTISITQKETQDPTKHVEYSGAINEEQIVLGTLRMKPHTVMLRGVNVQPVVENWGGLTYRLWQATYEFAYKRNRTQIDFPGGGWDVVDLGWDIAVPQTGYNVKCFTPGTGNPEDYYYGQPLALDDGAVAFDMGLPFLPQGLIDGQRARAMVEIPNYAGRKMSLAPSASPIALNNNGRPRDPDLEPLVYGYQVQPELNFTQTLALRLF